MASKSGRDHDDYLQQLSHRVTPRITLHVFIFQNFSIIDFISPTINTITKNVYVRSVSERVLLNLGCSTNFASDFLKEWVEKPAARTAANIFFNNEQNTQMNWLE